mgnify:CR=1 FL=1
MASNDEELASGIIEALEGLKNSPICLALSGSKFASMAEEARLKVCHEGFADRAYNKDGTLVSRNREGAVIHDPEALAKRAVKMVKEDRVKTIEGEVIDIRVDSICVHGDSPEATENVTRLTEAFEQEGIKVTPMRKL